VNVDLGSVLIRSERVYNVFRTGFMLIPHRMAAGTPGQSGGERTDSRRAIQGQIRHQLNIAQKHVHLQSSSKSATWWWQQVWERLVRCKVRSAQNLSVLALWGQATSKRGQLNCSHRKFLTGSLVDERTAADVGGVGSIPPSSRRRDSIPPPSVDEAWHSYIIYNIHDWV